MIKKQNKKKKTVKKKTIKKKQTTYKNMIRLKQKGKLSKQKSKQLSKKLNEKYCKCVKKVKKTLKTKKSGGEYPICTSSIYNKRGFKPPKNKNKNCKKSKIYKQKKI